MTMDDLKAIRPLKELIRQKRQRLNDLRAAASTKTIRFDDTPHSSGISDRVGVLVPEMVDLEGELLDDLTELQRRLAELNRYINSVSDIRVRLILILRYENGLSWMDVAREIGGRETEGSVKAAARRYIQKTMEDK